MESITKAMQVTPAFVHRSLLHYCVPAGCYERRSQRCFEAPAAVGGRRIRRQTPERPDTTADEEQMAELVIATDDRCQDAIQLVTVERQ
ncbi:hypothetical protein GN244_ATG02011 [Phytophthora infestans]|uniref:Uncharacterized protein n=1 Tax=Phytophthora infestans TaxID=4787 RepID=A0A833T971_PHYIN|nr:hypothetical protein GN244_ATG02011 [Phytophthora infestans]